MQTILIASGGLGQTLAMVCFGIAILALLYVYRRGLVKGGQRRRKLDRVSLDENERRLLVGSAQQHINSIDEKQRWEKLQSSHKVPRRPGQSIEEARDSGESQFASAATTGLSSHNGLEVR
jgi:hypothetical protein